MRLYLFYCFTVLLLVLCFYAFMFLCFFLCFYVGQHLCQLWLYLKYFINKVELN